MQYKLLSIAGFDGSGGAGIQADLKTFSALGCYGMTVLTALPVQNTMGVKSCYEIPLQAIEAQLESIFEDIVPDAIKIGMLFQGDIIELVAAFLSKYARGTKRTKGIPIVLDPVMVAKSGDALLQTEALALLKQKMVPLATVLTPNLPEACALMGVPLTEISDSLAVVGAALLGLGPEAVLLKGGHLGGAQSDDLYLDHTQTLWLEAPRIVTHNTHGTGCTLSAAIACGLAKGMSGSDACRAAKRYLHGAIDAAKGMQIGKRHGPVHHFYATHAGSFYNSIDITKTCARVI